MQGFGTALALKQGTSGLRSSSYYHGDGFNPGPPTIYNNGQFLEEISPGNYGGRITDALDANHHQLRRKKQNLEQLNDNLTQLEDFTHNAHSKFTLHQKMKDELTTKSYSHHPMHQVHQDLLRQLETSCQELTATLAEIDHGDPCSGTAIMQDSNALHKLKNP